MIFSPTLSTSKVSLHIKFITHILLYDIQCHKNIKCRHMSLYHNSFFLFKKKAPFIVIFFHSHENSSMTNKELEAQKQSTFFKI